MADPPAWLLGLLERPSRNSRPSPGIVAPKEAPRSLEALAQAVAGASEGRRNNYLFWATRRALDEGIPARIAAQVLRAAAADAGLDAREIEATIGSAIREAART